jgi:hypothetical protein
VEIYSNAVRLRMSAWDITLVFSTQAEVSPGKQQPEDRASVTMSPQHFKALAHAVTNTLASYEALVGKIELAPQFIPKPDDVEELKNRFKPRSAPTSSSA